jgi:23S rRNA pseudouridine1911/1915/1917 synthase
MIYLQATPADRGQRLDHFLHRHLPQFSRSRLQQWIKTGLVRVDGNTPKPSQPLRGAEQITVQPAPPPPLTAFAENLPVEILYEDSAVIAVNKPAGMVVHIGAGHHSGTLVNALLHRFRSLSTVAGAERPGIVHRLDKLTSGILLVARTDAAHRALARQFAAREVVKTYLALVHGVLRRDHGFVEAPIERDPIVRTRMSCRTGNGRYALTEYTVVERFPTMTFLRIRLHTGRTHQIRVHLASLAHPIVGDSLYGAPKSDLPRFFLHAHRLEFVSPATAAPVSLQAPLPAELDLFLARLRGRL